MTRNQSESVGPSDTSSLLAEQLVCGLSLDRIVVSVSCPRQHAEEEGDRDSMMMGLMRKMQKQIDDMSQQMQVKDQPGEDNESVQSDLNSSEAGETSDETFGAQGGITPATLRSDVRAMQRAAERIAQFRSDDYDDEDDIIGGRTRTSGKKSGSLMTAADNIKKRIDWPHMHVQRVVAGEHVPVKYKELKMAEFVYGYLEMLDAHPDKWDREVMLGILKTLMRDAADFAWENAANF